jgi:hypothetical protein
VMSGKPMNQMLHGILIESKIPQAESTSPANLSPSKNDL